MGPGRLQSRRRPCQAQGRPAAPATPSIRGSGVHAEVVGDPCNGRTVGGDRLRLGQGPASLGAAWIAAARVGPRVG